MGIPSADVAVRSYRDAGCMISFLVVQTSISISAAEGLGQVAFPEHFPVDGKLQDVPESTMPRPRWMNSMVLCTIIMVVCTLFAWYQVAMQIMYSEPSRTAAIAPEAVGDALAVGVSTATAS